MTKGSALIADLNQACLFVREGITVRLSDSDQDSFVRNMVVLLVEARFDFAIWQPDAACIVDLGS